MTNLYCRPAPWPSRFLLLFLTFILLVPPLSAQNQIGDLFATCVAETDQDFVFARFSVQDVVNQPLGTNWNIPPVYHGPMDSWTRANLGQIYGITVDQRGNTYVAASAVFGPYFENGAAPTNPGRVYRIDAAGVITPLGVLPHFNGPAWNGNAQTTTFPGLGNLCYDPFHEQLLITNFEDGRIYRMIPSTGVIVGFIDPIGTLDQVPGFAPLGDRVWGIACHGTSKDDVTIYYSVWSEDRRTSQVPFPTAGPNTIHSMKLTSAGGFDASSNQLIYTQPPLGGPFQFSCPVADIAVSPDGNTLLLAERTMAGEMKRTFAAHSDWAHRSRLIQLDNINGSWAPRPLGHYDPGNSRNGAGGTDFGLWDTNPNDGDPGRCDSIVWCMSAPIWLGQTMRYYGFQSFPITGGNNANSVWVDIDGQPFAYDKGQLGDVEVYRNCCSLVDVEATPSKLGNCCFQIDFTNSYAENYYSAVEFNVLGTGAAQWMLQSADFSIGSSTNSQLVLEGANGGNIPTGAFSEILEVCINGTATPSLEVVWLDFNGRPICKDTLEMTCTVDPPSCLIKTGEELNCKDGEYVYSFSIQNVSNFTMESVDFHTVSGNVNLNPDPVDIPALAPGQSAGPFDVIISGPDAVYGNQWCFFLSGHSTDDPATSPWCCTDSTICCLTFPLCVDCDSLDAYLESNPLNCRFELHLVNNFDANSITHVETELLNGGTVSNVFPGPDFIQASTATQITWGRSNNNPFPVGDLVAGRFNATYTPDPHIMAVRWFSDDSLLCTDTLIFSCDSSCIGVVQDSIYCGSDGSTLYEFSMASNASFTIESLSFFVISPSTATVNPNPIGPVNIVPGGGYSGVVSIDGVAPGDDFCYQLVAHNHFGGNDHTQCCPSDTVCVTVPACSPCGPPTINMRGDGVICDGESEQLCVDLCVLGDCRSNGWIVWTLPNNTQAIGNCINANMPGNYCVEVFCGGVSLGTACQTITQLPPGYLNIEGAPSGTVCVNSQVTLFADYCCDNPSYLWSNGATTQSITVSTVSGINSYSVTTSCKGGGGSTDWVFWFGQFCELKKTKLEDSPEIRLEAVPNPFSQTTTLNFVLPESGRAEVKIYAASGQMLGTLFSGSVDGGRNYAQEISGEGLANGIYYVRLQTDSGTVLTRKLVLNR